MIGAFSVEAASGLWLDGTPRGTPAGRAAELECMVRVFFEIASAIGLSLHEERTLLDIERHDMLRLRMAPAKAFKLGGSKLERRVAYAIPILQRMIASMSC